MPRLNSSRSAGRRPRQRVDHLAGLTPPGSDLSTRSLNMRGMRELLIQLDGELEPGRRARRPAAASPRRAAGRRRSSSPRPCRSAPRRTRARRTLADARAARDRTRRSTCLDRSGSSSRRCRCAGSTSAPVGPTFEVGDDLATRPARDVEMIESTMHADGQRDLLLDSGRVDAGRAAVRVRPPDGVRPPLFVVRHALRVSRGSKRTLDEVVADVERYGCPLVEITGGEPLLQDDVYPLMRAAARQRPHGAARNRRAPADRAAFPARSSRSSTSSARRAANPTRTTGAISTRCRRTTR